MPSDGLGWFEMVVMDWDSLKLVLTNTVGNRLLVEMEGSIGR